RVPSCLVLLGASLGLALMRFARLRLAAALCLLLSAVGAFAIAKKAAVERSEPADVLELVMPAVTPDDGVVAEIANVAPWRARLNISGMLLLVAGAAAAVHA